jgi:hypothetical protein
MTGVRHSPTARLAQSRLVLPVYQRQGPDHRIEKCLPVRLKPGFEFRPACCSSGYFTLARCSRILPAAWISGYGTATVTRKKVAGMEVEFMPGLLFWLLNRTSSSFCRSPALPFFSAASNAFMVGP